jgi:hypothetical protein
MNIITYRQTHICLINMIAHQTGSFLHEIFECIFFAHGLSQIPYITVTLQHYNPDIPNNPNNPNAHPNNPPAAMVTACSSLCSSADP